MYTAKIATVLNGTIKDTALVTYPSLEGAVDYLNRYAAANLETPIRYVVSHEGIYLVSIGEQNFQKLISQKEWEEERRNIAAASKKKKRPTGERFSQKDC